MSTEMALRKIFCIFFSFVLVAGLLPGTAYGLTSAEKKSNSEQNEITTENQSNQNNSVSEKPENNINKDFNSSQDSISDSSNSAEKLGSDDAEASVSDDFAEISSKTTNNVVLDDGIYLLVPYSNSGLNYSVSKSQLTAKISPRSDVLMVSFDAQGIATISNEEGKILSSQGSELVFSEASDSTTQDWLFIKSSTNGYVIQNIATQMVLDISSGKIQEGTNVRLYQANGTAAQNWNLEEVGTLISGMDVKAESSRGLLDENSTYYIETALSTNKVVDVSGASTSNGANVQLYDFNKTGAQQWKVQYDDKGYITFYNVSSGKVLDVSSGSATSGTNVQQYQANNSYAQKWLVYKNDNGTYSIESALWPNLSLDIAGASTSNRTNVRIYSSNDTSAQQFNLISEAKVRDNLDAKASSNIDVLSDGTYLINSSLANNKVLDVKSGSTANGANVQLYQSNMTNAQKWEVTHDEKGYVTFTNVGSGKVLDVNSAAITPKTNVQQYISNDSLAQKWIVSKNENGTYSIESALWSGICLDVADASSANGANAQIYNLNGTKAQEFTFINTNPKVEPCKELGLEGKYFKISSSIDRSYILDIASASMENGANVQLYADNGTYAQLFMFKFIKTDGDKGFYQIISAKSDKALDLDSGNCVNGTNIQQWDNSTQSDNRLFSITCNEDGSYTFINKASGLAIDVSNGKAANGANIQGYAPNNSIAQRFNLEEVTNLMQEGIVTLYSALSSSKVVDVSSGSMSNGANVQLYSANGSLAQKWNVVRVGDNIYTLQSVRSGMNLAVSGDNVIQQSPSDSDAQKWMPSISKGQTVLKNILTGKVLDVESASTANGANIQTYSSNGTNAQLFDVKTASLLNSGIYEIQAFSNINYVVDIASGSSVDGANIQLYRSNNTAAQKWNVVQNSDGSFTFKNALNGKALDLESGIAKEGANIRQWTSNGSAAQKWFAKYIDGGGIRLVSAVDSNYSIGIESTSLTNGLNIELQQNSNSSAQRFTFEPTTPPLPSDQQTMLNKISGYSSGSSWLIAVDRSTHKVGVFKGSANNWSIQYYWSCTTGAPGSPTITGSYRTTGFKRMTLSTDSRARWCTQIWSGYFFHSILASESELGKSLSHGCVRMSISAAQWIYNNIGVGTTVVIYN